YRCGSIGLSAVGEALSSNAPALPGLRGEPATEQGLSFADLSNLAQRYQLPMVAVELPTDADPVVPSVMHYQLGHFAALLKREGNRYLVFDPVFRKARWVKEEVLQAESSRRFLIPAGKVAGEFRRLTTDEQAKIGTIITSTTLLCRWGASTSMPSTATVQLITTFRNLP